MYMGPLRTGRFEAYRLRNVSASRQLDKADENEASKNSTANKLRREVLNNAHHSPSYVDVVYTAYVQSVRV